MGCEQVGFINKIVYFLNYNEIEPKYVMDYLMSPKGRSLLNPTAGGGTYNVSATDFQKMQISHPNLIVQQQIISELEEQKEVFKGLYEMKAKAQKKTNQILAKVWGVEYVEPVKMEVEDE